MLNRTPVKALNQGSGQGTIGVNRLVGTTYTIYELDEMKNSISDRH